LRSRDKFFITVDIERSGNVRLVFKQAIFRLNDKKLIASARVTGVATRNGRPVSPGILVKQLGLD
jgi:acyl-CoA thioester hydrolase